MILCSMDDRVRKEFENMTREVEIFKRAWDMFEENMDKLFSAELERSDPGPDALAILNEMGDLSRERAEFAEKGRQLFRRLCAAHDEVRAVMEENDSLNQQLEDLKLKETHAQLVARYKKAVERYRQRKQTE